MQKGHSCLRMWRETQIKLRCLKKTVCLLSYMSTDYSLQILKQDDALKKKRSKIFAACCTNREKNLFVSQKHIDLTSCVCGNKR